VSSNTNPQVKTKANPPPPPPPQIQEPQQQNDTFPTHGTILTITGGSNTDFDTKRQRRGYYREVNHVVVEGPITQTKWSHSRLKDPRRQWHPSRNTLPVRFKKNGLRQEVAQRTDEAPIWLRRQKNQPHGSHSIARLIWHPAKPLYRVHNLRCGRLAISLQCHLQMRAIKHFRSHPACKVPLPQSPSNLRHNNNIWQSKGS
jgi:hypothetical protein